MLQVFAIVQTAVVVECAEVLLSLGDLFRGEKQTKRERVRKVHTTESTLVEFDKRLLRVSLLCTWGRV